MSENNRKPFSVPRFKLPAVVARVGNKPVSYTHLDVYKRQVFIIGLLVKLRIKGILQLRR